MTRGGVRSSMGTTTEIARVGRGVTAAIVIAVSSLALVGTGCGTDEAAVSPAGTAETSAALPSVESAAVLVGLDIEGAIAQAAARGWEVRVMRLDGEDQLGTADYVVERVNVAVDDEIVTEILSIG